MLKNRTTLKKRCASFLLILAMLFTFMPVLGVQQAFAGGGTDIDGIINGLNGDGTVNVRDCAAIARDCAMGLLG